MSLAPARAGQPAEGLRPLDEMVRLLDAGVSIFDEGYRLVFCNPTFRDIFELPEAEVPLGTPLVTLVRDLAERGVYGEVDPDLFVTYMLGTLETMEGPFLYERRLPDGRIFESNTSRLANGGFLAIHTDITHHKRTEEELRASQRQVADQKTLLQTSIDNMPGAMAVWDKDLRYVLWSRHGEAFFNLPLGFLKVGMPLADVVRFFAERGDYGPGNIEAHVEAQMRPFRERAAIVAERIMPDGRTIQSHRNPLPDGGYVSIFKDISPQKRLENELRQAKEIAEAAAEELFRKQKQIKALLDSSGQGFLSFGSDLVVQGAFSQACLSIFGRSPADRIIDSLLYPEDPNAARTLRQTLEAAFAAIAGEQRQEELARLPRDFELGGRILHAMFRPLEDGKIMLVLTDVTAEHRLTVLSNTDRLTGLANRRKLDEHLLTEQERAARSGLPLSLIIADIDHFKAINDRHGHLAGDQALRDFAQLLRDRVRKSDWLGRWGGEEFMILCPNTDLDGARRLAEELRMAVLDAGQAGNLVRTSSFGLSMLTPNEPIEDLIQRADAALYQAKRRGRNQVCARSE